MNKSKFIGIKADENIDMMDFTGYKCLSDYVHGSYDIFHTMKFKSGYIDFMCNDECCTNKSENFKKINVFATSICKNSLLIYGNILLVYTDEDGKSKGFTDDECNQILTEIKRVISNPKYKEMQGQMHKLFDR